jgi:hypothetical protein
LLIEIKALAEEYATDQLAPYIEHVKKPYVSFGAKEINDALWGTIRLSPLEAAILDSPFLQRLRSIRQLGVVHWVYGNRAMLLVSGYNVPTQVLTCLWQDGMVDGVHWQSLLRRRKKE